MWIPKDLDIVPGVQDIPAHREAKELFYGRFIIPFAKVWMRYVQRLKVELHNPERIPADGGAVLAVNHTGYWDFVFGAVPAAFHGQRLVRFMAKKEIWDNAVAGPVMSGMHHIPVDRTDGQASVREAISRAADGDLIGIFPEATISRSFEIKDFRDGAARIAQDAGVPLVPVVLWGSQRIWTKGRKPIWRPKDAALVIYVGEPVDTDGDPREVTDRLHGAMVGLLDEARARYTERFGPFPDGEYWMPASLGGSAPTLEEATAKDRADSEARKAERIRRDAEKAAGVVPEKKKSLPGRLLATVRGKLGR